jgi:hypothetical protein
MRPATKSLVDFPLGAVSCAVVFSPDAVIFDEAAKRMPAGGFGLRAMVIKPFTEFAERVAVVAP